MSWGPLTPVPATAEAIARAVHRLRLGGLVGLPTETVYGLAADADQPTAVARVYAAKGRPADHPLIVHLADAAKLDSWVTAVPEYAGRLAAALWPGPLTLVLPRSSRAGDHVTGGQDTVALRVPDHPVALAVLHQHGGGLAAPSANRFGRVSPTTAAHVAAELAAVLDPDRDLILDGGPTRVGVESSIVDCTGPAPVILRPGAVPVSVIEETGGVPVASSTASAPVRAPGMLAAHYAPTARVVIVDDAGLPDILSGTTAAPTADPTVGLLAQAGIGTPAGFVRLAAPADTADYARVLYAALREADALRLQRVMVVPPPPVAGPASAALRSAILDRLRRAAAG